MFVRVAVLLISISRPYPLWIAGSKRKETWFEYLIWILPQDSKGCEILCQNHLIAWFLIRHPWARNFCPFADGSIAKPKYRWCHVMSLDGNDTFFPPGQAKRKCLTYTWQNLHILLKHHVCDCTWIGWSPQFILNEKLGISFGRCAYRHSVEAVGRPQKISLLGDVAGWHA